MVAQSWLSKSCHRSPNVIFMRISSAKDLVISEILGIFLQLAAVHRSLFLTGEGRCGYGQLSLTISVRLDCDCDLCGMELPGDRAEVAELYMGLGQTESYQTLTLPTRRGSLPYHPRKSGFGNVCSASLMTLRTCVVGFQPRQVEISVPQEGLAVKTQLRVSL